MAVFADKAVVAVVAFSAVKAVVAVIAEDAERAVVAVLAFPVRSPTKFEEVIDAKPDKLVYVPPKVATVDPNVNREFANCPFVMPAVADKLAVVNPETAIELPVRTIPDPAVRGV